MGQSLSPPRAGRAFPSGACGGPRRYAGLRGEEGVLTRAADRLPAWFGSRRIPALAKAPRQPQPATPGVRRPVPWLRTGQIGTAAGWILAYLVIMVKRLIGQLSLLDAQLTLVLFTDAPKYSAKIGYMVIKI